MLGRDLGFGLDVSFHVVLWLRLCHIGCDSNIGYKGVGLSMLQSVVLTFLSIVALSNPKD